MSGSRLSPDFETAIGQLLSILAQALQRATPWVPVLDPAAARVRLVQDALRIPVRYELHWRRFGVVPTELAHEAAYAAHALVNPEGDEADRLTFAEVFVRDHVLASER